jgi:hypothetical protein
MNDIDNQFYTLLLDLQDKVATLKPHSPEWGYWNGLVMTLEKNSKILEKGLAPITYKGIPVYSSAHIEQVNASELAGNSSANLEPARPKLGPLVTQVLAEHQR